MFCPDCGQQQVSEDIRFCSRCGLPLSIVAAVAANGGMLPESGSKKPFLNRRTGMAIGVVWILFFLVILTPVAKILLKEPEDYVVLTMVFGFFIGALMVIGSGLFLPREPRERRSDFPGDEMRGPRRFGDRHERGSLSPARSVPVEIAQGAMTSRWKTNDLLKNAGAGAPPSVTDHTTRLLHKDGE
jgi:hypothetical protein